jgi:8-oxo-dGTP pyrophosphatase MutT (NUDIX family)
MMKLVGIDSSLSARRELAEELGYKGDMKDSAKMNIWLHREMLQRIAANGGQLPDDLLD